MAISPNAIGYLPVRDRVVDTAFADAQHAVVLTAIGDVSTLDLTTRKVVIGRPVDAAPLPIALGADGSTVIRADASISRIDGSAVAARPAEEFVARAARTSDDGKLVALIGVIGDVLVRDCRSLPCVDTLMTSPEPGQLATSLAVKPDGSALAINWTGGVAVYADVTAAPNVIPLPAEASSFGSALGMDWSAATGRIALSTDSGHLLQIDPDAGTVVADVAMGLGTMVLEWSPAAPLLAAPCDQKTICIYDESFTVTAAFGGHNNRIGSIHWSPDGQSLISTAPNDPVRLWSLRDDAGVMSLLRVPGWTALTALDTSNGLVAAGDETGVLWLWDSAGERFRMAGSAEGMKAIASVAFLADGRVAAVHQSDAVAVWSEGKAEPDRLIELDNLSFSRVAALSGDIRAAVPLSDKSILALSGDELRDARIARDSMPLDQWGLVAAPAANTAFVSYSDGSIRRRDLGAGGEGAVVFDANGSLCGAPTTTDNNGAKSLDVSADGKWLVTTRTDSIVIVHNLADPTKPVCFTLPAPDSKTVAFSPDSSKLAILSATDRLYLFDLNQPDSALILGAPAVPDNSPIAVAAGPARKTSWLAWRDDTTIAISTMAGAVESIDIRPESWRARVDTLYFAP
jgi:WD40 repeat protein